MMTLKTIATYARVSTSLQEEQKTIETQIMAIKDFSREKGYTIIKEYADEGFSGNTLNRPGLDQLRVDAQKKPWDAVLMYDPDRLARRYSYQELVSDELREEGIEVLFVTTPTPKDGVEKIIYGVQGLFAEYERAKIRERFRLGRLRRAKEGNIVVSRPAYGYTLVRKRGKKGESNFRAGHYEVNTVESEIVKKIFSWIGNDGYSLRRITRELQLLNVKPRFSKRTVWSIAVISKMLKNKTYIGEAHFGATRIVLPKNIRNLQSYAKHYTQVYKPEEEWVKIKVPAIIEPSLFEKVQLRLAKNKTESKRNTKNFYLLAHRIFCVCGYRRGGVTLHKKNSYYVCYSKVRQYPLPSLCSDLHVRADWVDLIVWNLIKDALTNPELLLKYIKDALKDHNSNELKNFDFDLNRTKEEVEALKALKEKYIQMYSIDVISLDELNTYNKGIKTKLESKNKQIEEASKTNNEKLATLPKFEELNAYAAKATKFLPYFTKNDKQNLIKASIEKVVSGKSRLIITAYLPEINDQLCSHDRSDVDTIGAAGIGSSSIKIPFSIQIDLEKEIKKYNFPKRRVS